MDRTYTAEQIVAIGGKRWKPATGNAERVYLNFWEELVEFEVDRYGTGNIRSAALMGQHLSNSVASKVAGTKVWLASDGRIKTTLEALAYDVGRYGVEMEEVLKKLHKGVADRVDDAARRSQADT